MMDTQIKEHRNDRAPDVAGKKRYLVGRKLDVGDVRQDGDLLKELDGSWAATMSAGAPIKVDTDIFYVRPAEGHIPTALPFSSEATIVELSQRVTEMVRTALNQHASHADVINARRTLCQGLFDASEPPPGVPNDIETLAKLAAETLFLRLHRMRAAEQRLAELDVQGRLAALEAKLAAKL